MKNWWHRLLNGKHTGLIIAIQSIAISKSNAITASSHGYRKKLIDMYYRIWINNNDIYREAKNEEELLSDLYEEYEHDSIDEVEEITEDEYDG
jgi:hypothetical protein